MAFDPLSSQGIYTAMYSGVAAARAILASEAGDGSAMPGYASRLDSVRRVYRVRLASAYGSVSRWPDAPFWAMRDRWNFESNRQCLELRRSTVIQSWDWQES
jgi:flavin-dependent dehydrogenase